MATTETQVPDWDAPVSNLSEVGQEPLFSDPEIGDGKHVEADGDVEAVQRPSSRRSRPESARAGAQPLEMDAPLRDIGEASYKPIFAETVHGPDDRVQITGTNVFPWRAHASLRITAADGSGWIGTGWFIGPRTLITAGHVVFIKNNPIPERNGWVRRIEVMPGRNGPELPFGSAISESFHSVRGWSERGDPEYDYGAIQLPESSPLGDTVGWIGFAALSDAELQSTHLNISGYPGDKPAGTQWYDHRVVDSVSDRKVFYDIDTAGGQSGSAVYRIVNGVRHSVGIHAYGGSRVNSATRINRRRFENLQLWNV
ncbi:MAG: trypsin-like serine peptidase [Geminicoccaceae bacterium]